MTKRIISQGLCAALFLTLVATSALRASDRRETPLVRAVKKAKSAVVNIHSEKPANPSSSIFPRGKSRKINGMGTGIVVDERGYIVTNYHVVHDVDTLRVTLHDGSTYTAKVVSYDRREDLAIIKIDPSKSLNLMPLGTSSDLMLGESVFAVGNAFGYEHTVTAGIISSLSRDVEVNSETAYRNLIQTDASINPGNSGGPLLNLDGEVVGINVAIRAGAQRIGFAIPIDEARRIIARLLNVEKLNHKSHGIIATDVKTAKIRHLKVKSLVKGSPAEKVGLKPGDVIKRVGDVRIVDGADLERAFLGRDFEDGFKVVVERAEEQKTFQLALNDRRPTIPPRAVVADESPKSKTDTQQVAPEDSRTWNLLGVKLAPLPDSEKHLVAPLYRGGMRIVGVRSDSPAAHNGIKEGDILVGLHVWETVTPKNVEYVMNHPELNTFAPLRFYILRGEKTLYGHMQVASATR